MLHYSLLRVIKEVIVEERQWQLSMRISTMLSSNISSLTRHQMYKSNHSNSWSNLDSMMLLARLLSLIDIKKYSERLLNENKINNFNL